MTTSPSVGKRKPTNTLILLTFPHFDLINQSKVKTKPLMVSFEIHYFLSCSLISTRNERYSFP
jgi:hypothetical protein